MKIIELKNKTLASCSWDCSFIFYIKDNLKYKKDYQVSINYGCNFIFKTKDKEICYDEYNLCFYDLFERKVKASMSNLSKYDMRNMIMMTKDLLLILGEKKYQL